MADARAALEELLHSLGESAQFVASGEMPATLPGLEVDGVGMVRTPVSAADAKRLIAQAVQAPYGRGEETIVDTDVRRVWQIEPDAFRLRNETWELYVAAIVENVKAKFGIARKVAAQLYKLLIYEKGSFFAPHRDTEKTAGMFATLVVCLPSKHEGGRLIVRHDGQTKTIDFGGKDAEFKARYAAFYADCQHEITPVTAGYRICLVYNLALAGKKQPRAPQNAPAVERAKTLLGNLFASTKGDDVRDKIAIPFEHQYTEAGLGPEQLKGADRVRFEVLCRAAEDRDYQIYLALLTHYQSGDVDYSTYEPPSRSRWGGRSWGRRYWDRYDDEDDADEESGDDESGDDGVEIGEIFDEEIKLEHFRDAAGRKQAIGELSLKKNEILCGDDREGWSMRQEVHEATGNEGVSVNRWYHQGAMVIWPRERFFGVLAREGQVKALPALEKMAKLKKRNAADCLRFAEQIIIHWQPGRRAILDGYRAGGSCSGRMLAVLARVGTAELVYRFVNEVLPKDFDGSEGMRLVELGDFVDWSALAEALRGFLGQQAPTAHNFKLAEIVQLIADVCAAEPPSLTDERRAAGRLLAEDLANLIERRDTAKIPEWQRSEEKRDAVVAGAVRALAATDAAQSLDRFVTRIVADAGRYDVRLALIPAALALHRSIGGMAAGKQALTRLREHCIAQLRAATAHPVETLPDWKRDAKLTCKCADCRAVNDFLKNPNERVLRLPMGKDRRRHLHQQIEARQCDLTHTTHRVGSPQTLVCTKTQASHERRLKQFASDQKHLAQLEALAAKAPATGVRRKQTARRATAK